MENLLVNSLFTPDLALLMGTSVSDRLLEVTGTISPHRDNKQVLDRLTVEKERGTVSIVDVD